MGVTSPRSGDRQRSWRLRFKTASTQLDFALGNDAQDALQHAIEVPTDIGVPEAQHPVALLA